MYSTIDINSTVFVVGRTYPSNPGNYFNGYIDDLKVTKGLSRYNTSFTVPSTFNSTGETDPYKNSVSLYLNSDGINNDHVISDSSNYNHAIVSIDGAIISNLQYVNDLCSIHFKGTTSNCPYIEHNNSLDLYDANNWTIEFCVYLTDNKSLFIISKDGKANVAYPQYRITVTDTLISIILGTGSNSATLQTISTPTLDSIAGKWVHFAAVNDNKIISLFVDGIKVESKPITNLMLSGSSRLYLGTEQGQSWKYDAYIDELKITKGVARYKVNFSPITTDQSVYLNNIQYSIVPTKVRVAEGDIVTFVVTTNDLNHNGYVDIVINKISDSFTPGDYSINDLAPTKLYIKNGLGKYDISISNDNLFELPEVFNVSIWKLNKYNTALATSCDVTIIDKTKPLNLGYSIVSSNEIVDEDMLFVFDVFADVPDGTVLYYTLFGTIDNLDIIGSLVGQVVINSKVSTIYVNSFADHFTEPVEKFRVMLYADASKNTFLDASKTISINDTSKTRLYHFVESSLSVDEGQSITFTVNTEYVEDGYIVYYKILGAINNQDTTDEFLGELVINNSTAFFTFNLLEDHFTEGVENFTVGLYQDINRTILLATSKVITVNDTSVNYVYTIEPDVFTIVEGETVTFTLTTDVPIGTVLYYQITGTTNSQDILELLTNEITVITGVEKLALTFIDNKVFEGTEILALNLYTDSSYINMVTISPTVTVLDTGDENVLPIIVNNATNRLYNANSIDIPFLINDGINKLYNDQINIEFNLIGPVATVDLVCEKYTFKEGERIDFLITTTGIENSTIIELKKIYGDVTDADFSLDVYSQNIVLYIKGVGPDASTSIGDASISHKVLTTTGNVNINTTVFKRGTGSVLIDNSSNSVSYVTTPASVDFAFDIKDFTIEFWANKITDSFSGLDHILSTAFDNSGLGGWYISCYQNNFSFGHDGINIISYEATGVLDGLWHHYAITRQFNNFMLFVDGVLLVTVNAAISIIANNNLVIGCLDTTNGISCFNGYIDELKITNGVARYINDFNPEITGLVIINGTTMVQNGSATYSLIARLDGESEGPETFKMGVSYINSTDILAVSPIITIEDN